MILVILVVVNVECNVSVDHELSHAFEHLAAKHRHLSDRFSAVLMKDAQHDVPIEEQCLVDFLRSQTQRDLLAADTIAASRNIGMFLACYCFDKFLIRNSNN